MSTEIKISYYDINQVAAKFQLEPSTLRFWEKEFPMLKPEKRGGDRIYTPEDVEMLVEIVDLVKKKKYTLKGARIYIETNRARVIKINRTIRQLEEVKLHMEHLRDFMG